MPDLEAPPINPLAYLEDTNVPVNTPQANEPPEDKRISPPDKKDKGVQVSELRKAKDKAEAELAEALKKIESAEKLKALQPIAEYLEKKSGKLDEEVVNKFIEKNRERKKQVSEFDQKLKEKEETLKAISIDHSEEFNNNYIKPLKQEQGNLIAIIANIDNERKIKHPKLVESFFQQLVQIDDKGEPLDSLSIKKLMIAFEDDYRKQTGEDYEMPELKEVVNQVRTVVSKLKSTIDAKRNWSKVQEESQKEKLFEQAEAERIRIKKETDSRNYVTNKVINEYDFTTIEDIIPKDEFVEGIKENNNYFNGLLTGDQKVKPKKFDEAIVEMTKAKLFDKVVEKFREIQEELKTEKAKNKSGLPGNGGSPKPQASKDGRKAEGFNPLGYLET